MRQKVVLYNPQAVFYAMPLSLIAVGSMLDPRHYDVRIVDARLEADAANRVIQECSDAVCFGVTVLTGAPIQDALRMTRLVKSQFPNLPTVWGGWHPSLFPLETLAEPAVDFTVQGQGEPVFATLLDRLVKCEGLHGLQGLGYREEGVVKHTPPSIPQDMNDFPPADYGLIPVERYFRLKDRRQLDYISSIGCHYRCSFCADPFVFGRRWKGLHPRRIAQEIEDLWRSYNFEDLSFQDETFFTFPQRIRAMAEEFLSRGLRFTWTGTMRADQGARLSDQDFEACVRSGLRRVLVGVEAGSQEMLDWMKKDITVEQVLATAEKCVRHGVAAIFPFIVGFPGESRTSIDSTLALVKKLRAMDPRFETPIFYFKPYPGSEITSEAVRNGFSLPTSLEQWATFDFVDGSAGPWVDVGRYRRIERFKFYNRFAGGIHSTMLKPLMALARWRCKWDIYTLPIEKMVIDKVRPRPKLS